MSSWHIQNGWIFSEQSMEFPDFLLILTLLLHIPMQNTIISGTPFERYCQYKQTSL